VPDPLLDPHKTSVFERSHARLQRHDSRVQRPAVRPRAAALASETPAPPNPQPPAPGSAAPRGWTRPGAHVSPSIVVGAPEEADPSPPHVNPTPEPTPSPTPQPAPAREGSAPGPARGRAAAARCSCARGAARPSRQGE